MPTYCTCSRRETPHAPSRLCEVYAAQQSREALEACPGFDPGDVLAAYGGRRCIHCNQPETDHSNNA